MTKLIFPMESHDQAKYDSLQIIDIPADFFDKAPWLNQTLTTVNETAIRLAIIEGEFPWHKHGEQDEFFLVLDGEIFLDVEGSETALLRKLQGFTVPRGVMHRPREDLGINLLEGLRPVNPQQPVSNQPRLH